MVHTQNLVRGACCFVPISFRRGSPHWWHLINTTFSSVWVEKGTRQNGRKRRNAKRRRANCLYNQKMKKAKRLELFWEHMKRFDFVYKLDALCQKRIAFDLCPQALSRKETYKKVATFRHNFFFQFLWAWKLKFDFTQLSNDFSLRWRLYRLSPALRNILSQFGRGLTWI